MNQHLQKIVNLLQQVNSLSAEEKMAALKSLKDADKEMEIANFKLDRTEKVKRTTAILLEETIQELELKRKAVEAQNHELEIEAALERVRTVALSMNKPGDMLEVCLTIATELDKLNVTEIRNVQTAIFYEDKGTYMNYEYYAKHTKTFITETSYTNHEIHRAFAEQMLKGKDESFSTYISKAELPAWIAYQKTTNVFIDAFLETADSLNYYWHSLGPVALGISTYTPLSDDQHRLFGRFLKVFELAYRRYLDIENATAQAREAKIEASLERVRARTMGMHKSEELKDVIQIVYEQLIHLDIETSHAGFIMDYKTRTDYNTWIADQFGSPAQIAIPYFDCIYYNRFNKAKEEGLDFFATVLSREEKNSFYETLFENIPDFPEESKKIILNEPGFTISTTLLENVALYIENFTGIPYSDEVNEILIRFGKVFQQTYTRFLDLQKAEAQAREGQIQLALERVRARTMAMQHSNELADASFVLDSQVRALGINTRGCAFNIYGDDESTEWFSSAEGSLPMYKTPREHLFLRCYEAGQRGEKIYIEEFEGENCKAHYEYLCTIPIMGDALRSMIAAGGSFPTRQIDHVVYFKYGYLLFLTLEPVPEAHDIFIRFAKVFEQTYTRFLDLQKAEAQAREAQIEAALEKIRSRSLAMHTSPELKDVIRVMFEKLRELDVLIGTVGIWLFNKTTRNSVFWVGNNLQEPAMVNLPYDEELMKEETNYSDSWNAFLSGHSYFNKEYTVEQKNKYFEYVFANNDFTVIPAEVRKFILAAPYHSGTLIVEENSCLFFDSWDGTIYSESKIQALSRAARVFEQAYTRFLDLQKAEALAREARIEAALERVRSVAMSMMKTDDLAGICKAVFAQLLLLGFKDLRCSQIYIRNDEVEKFINYDYSDDTNAVKQEISYNSHPNTRRIYDVISKAGDELIHNVIDKEQMEKWKSYLYNTIGQEPEKTLEHAEELHYYLYSFGIGAFGISNFKPITSEELEILKRFRNVFSLSYQRYTDISQAEAQAREAQIELGLERVRARAMAMQKSEELSILIATVYSELVKLEVVFNRCFIMIFDGTGGATWWMASHEAPEIQKGFYVKYHEHAPHLAYLQGWKNRVEKWEYTFEGEEKKNWDNFLFTETELTSLPDFVIEGMRVVQKVNLSASFNNFGCLTTGSIEPLTKDAFDILLRFAKVFDLTYTRFNDLKQAEEAASEAQVQLALERVRARTMAMQKSSELSEVVHVLYMQMKELGFTYGAGTITLIDEKTGDTDWWMAGFSQMEYPDSYHVNWFNHPGYEAIINAWRRKEKFAMIEIAGESKRAFDHIIFEHTGFSKLPEEVKNMMRSFDTVVYSLSYMKYGILSFGPTPVSEDHRDVLQRFASVFEQTYTRFLDLQKAEAQAKESHIEAALERVRSRTLAMQKSDELAETAAEVFRQLIGLGMEPNRLYIGIINGDSRDMEMWATDEDGAGVGKRFVFNAADNASVKKLYDGWVKKMKSLTVEMQGTELENYISYLQKLQIPLSHALTQKRRIQSVAYFDKGFIGMASPEAQPAETLQLLERFAAVVNLTFTRFNDLKIAEAHAIQAEQDLIAIKAARKKAEDTLTELQATQKQLIQSEKMASLGELTAGIAHEIQNPLNFVNNFSEVSKELIDEMTSELTVGNLQLATEIATDIKQNLEKINHHGKRADAIVKGMLQHSRSSTGQKEPTDINALADEYLRLAYHGLRAKDKLFNAALQTDFDSSIGKINVIPQDIGRVILNIVTNAFYAVNEKKKTSDNSYQPTVSLITRKLPDAVQITVEDNGNGIPKDIVDKIFQPFFTTKPTGQGTGLGLSLAYDIVKAHGGDLRVETKENEATTFIIHLPINN